MRGWKVSKPDANGEVGTQSAATQPEPTFSRQELGASLLDSIPQNLDNASDKRALFKDISIKKGSLYAGQTQNSTSGNVTLPADPNITIQQLVDFVKSDFAATPLFTDKMPQKTI